MTEAEKKAFEDLKKSNEALTKQVAELNKAGMSQDHKDYMAQMPEEKRGDFTAMSAADRNDYIAKNPVKKSKDEPVLKIGDTVITVTKAKVKPETMTIGDVTINKGDHPKYFDIIKAQNEALTKALGTLAELTEKSELDTLIAKVKADYPNLPGDPVEKAKALQAIAKVDPKARETLEKQMAAANKAMSDRFQETGSGASQVTVGSAEDQLNTLAKAHAETHKVSFAKAYDYVLTNNPKLYSDYVN